MENRIKCPCCSSTNITETKFVLPELISDGKGNVHYNYQDRRAKYETHICMDCGYVMLFNQHLVEESRISSLLMNTLVKFSVKWDEIVKTIDREYEEKDNMVERERSRIEKIMEDNSLTSKDMMEATNQIKELNHQQLDIINKQSQWSSHKRVMDNFYSNMKNNWLEICASSLYLEPFVNVITSIDAMLEKIFNNEKRDQKLFEKLMVTLNVFDKKSLNIENPITLLEKLHFELNK
ncbi:MAG: hypothetical protein HUJ61_03660 [Bacilli bacterium]|nr:hypothetical protein [Bacilli bacterium]